MENCNTNITIIQTEEKCSGKYTSTDCTSIPNNITYLDVSAGDSQTTVNAALVTALMYKDEQLGSLTISTETQMALDLKADLAGTQTFTGIHNFPTAVVGTNTNQVATTALVQAEKQDLQSVIDKGGYVSYNDVDGGDSYLNLLGGSVGNRSFEMSTDNTTVGSEKYSNFFLNRNSTSISNKVFKFGEFYEGGSSYTDGDFVMYQSVGNFNSTLRFRYPTVENQFYFPAKTIADAYTINTTPETIYTVSTLPTAVLNDMAIVTDATAPTYLGALVGGGSTVTPVWYNGTIWVSR